MKRRSRSILGILLVSVMLAFSSPAKAISEIDYEPNYRALVLPFLEKGERIEFLGVGGLRLSSVTFRHPDSRGTIVILPGRGESWLKYGEVAYDLYEKGYSIYCYDHRGQGLSPHLVAGFPQRDSIDHFEYFTKDFESFLKVFVGPERKAGEKLFLLAHSMGGAVALDYLAKVAVQGGIPFDAVAISSPMLAINTSPYPLPLAVAIACGNVSRGVGDAYAPGKKDFDPAYPFEKSEVTKSRERFWMDRYLIQEYPAITLGGPTNRWVCESLKATHRIAGQIVQANIPMLIFQAGRDQLVHPGAQDKACKKAKNCMRILFPESEHEIFNERDFIRTRALDLADELFSGRF